MTDTCDESHINNESKPLIYQLKKWLLKKTDTDKYYTDDEINQRTSFLKVNSYMNYFDPTMAKDNVILGKYLIESDLGEGSFGIVWRCKILNTNTRVAVKVVDLHQAKKNFDVDQETLLKEIELLQMLNSPYIMNLTEYQIQDQKLYLVCEFFEGKEILEVVEQYGGMSEADAKKAIYYIMLGTSHMHSMNIIHRDLKLENILIHINKFKEVDYVKIIDLGLGAKIEGSVSGFYGTPNYMPPEAFNHGQYDFKFDVFSIGVILYTMIACEFPFNADTINGLSKKIINIEPDYDVIKRAGGSAELIDLLKNLLRKDKYERFTLEEALKHSWFKTESNKKNNVVLSDSQKDDALYGLRNYNKLGKINKAIKIFNTKLGHNQDDIKHLREMFLKFDVDNNGHLDEEEFTNFLKYLSNDMSDGEIKNLFCLVDINNDKCINYDEFIAIFQEMKFFNEDLLIEYIFTQMDSKNINSITFDQMYQFFTDNQMNISKKEMREVFDRIDINKDGSISIKEFKYNIKKELHLSKFEEEISEDTSTSMIEEEYFEFTCIKEPRHEFFSGLKKQQRVVRMTEHRINYFDGEYCKGHIHNDGISLVKIHSPTDIEIFSRIKIHWLYLQNNTDIDSIINFMKNRMNLTDKIVYGQKYKDYYRK